jgi:hypothetical protein
MGGCLSDIPCWGGCHAHAYPRVVLGRGWSLAWSWFLVSNVPIQTAFETYTDSTTRFYGYHIVRALGNKITQMSPTRGFSVELGAAVTVLLASRLGLPVSTTQCLTGSAVGVALMNYDLGAVNWRQLAFIFSGWVSSLPLALVVPL